MKSLYVLGMGFALMFLLFSQQNIVGQEATPAADEVQSGAWLGSFTADEQVGVVGEIAFVVDTSGTVYNGGVHFLSLGDKLAEDEECLMLFSELSEETIPIAGSFMTAERAEGTYEISSCLVRDRGYITLSPPVTGTWEAAPAAQEDIATAIRIFARQPIEAVESGEALFNLRCSGCHGIGGVGTEIAPPFIDFWALTYDYIEGRVRSGPEVMSAFTETDLPVSQLNDIVTYIQDELVRTGIREYTEAELAAGHDLYIEKCAECHGSRGQGTNDFGPPLLIWPPYSVTGIYVGARIPLPEMPIVRVTNDELDLIAGYYLFELATDE